jgi:hypothetical protein
VLQTPHTAPFIAAHFYLCGLSFCSAVDIKRLNCPLSRRLNCPLSTLFVVSSIKEFCQLTLSWSDRSCSTHFGGHAAKTAFFLLCNLFSAGNHFAGLKTLNVIFGHLMIHLKLDGKKNVLTWPGKRTFSVVVLFLVGLALKLCGTGYRYLKDHFQTLNEIKSILPTAVLCLWEVYRTLSEGPHVRFLPEAHGVVDEGYQPSTIFRKPPRPIELSSTRPGSRAAEKEGGSLLPNA